MNAYLRAATRASPTPPGHALGWHSVAPQCAQLQTGDSCVETQARLAGSPAAGSCGACLRHVQALPARTLRGPVRRRGSGDADTADACNGQSVETKLSRACALHGPRRKLIRVRVGVGVVPPAEDRAEACRSTCCRAAAQMGNGTCSNSQLGRGSGEQRIMLPVTPSVRPHVRGLPASPPELLCRHPAGSPGRCTGPGGRAYPALVSG